MDFHIKNHYLQKFMVKDKNTKRFRRLLPKEMKPLYVIPANIRTNKAKINETYINHFIFGDLSSGLTIPYYNPYFY